MKIGIRATARLGFALACGSPAANDGSDATLR
jgi:hypothetical protein